MEKRLRVSLSLPCFLPVRSSYPDSRQRLECANVLMRTTTMMAASVRACERTEARESRPPCPDASMRRPNKRERSERAERDAQEERIRNRSRAREGEDEGKGEREGETDRERTERTRTSRVERKDTPGACATIPLRVKERRRGWLTCEGKRKGLSERRGVGGEDARGGTYTVAS